MSQLLFILLLIFPVVWRLMFASVFRSIHRSLYQFVLFILPIIIVGIVLFINRGAFGLDGVAFIIMLAMFWGPQLAIIGFFIWCDWEDDKQSPCDPAE